MYNNDNRFNDAIEKLTDNEKYELMKQLEEKDNININTNIIDTIVTASLELTTVIAKILHII